MTKLRSNQAGVAHLAGIMALVLVVAVGGVGYSVYNSQSKKSDQSNSVTEKTETKTKDALPAGFVPAVTVDKVKEVATAEAPGQDVLSIQLEMEDNKVVYSVKLADGTKLYVDATTGAVVKRVAADGTKVSDDSDDDSSSPLPADFVPAISAATARSTAEAKLPGKSVEVVKLEVEDGKKVWSVRFTDGSRVDVDATSGAVVRTKNNAPQSSTSTTNSGTSNSGSTSSGSGSSGSDDSNDDEDDSSDDSGSNSGSGSSGGGHSSDD